MITLGHVFVKVIDQCMIHSELLLTRGLTCSRLGSGSI